MEIDGQLRKVLMVIKMRGGSHSRDIREYTITGKGMEVMPRAASGYARLTTGLPEQAGRRGETAPGPEESA